MSALLEHLEAIFGADRIIRASEQRLLADLGNPALQEALVNAVHHARSLADRSEGAMQLERLADLCAQVPGPRMADALIDILDDDEPSVRVAAGEALLDVAYERYAEIARAIERRLEKASHGPALQELPWVIAEIGEPSALSLIRKFVESNDAEVVAAAIEALASLGDPAAIPILTPLCSDRRQVTIEEDDSELTTTVGQLAEETCKELGGKSA